MSPKRLQILPVVLALITVSGCTQPQTLEEQALAIVAERQAFVEKHVTDKDRAQRATAILGDIAAATRKYCQSVTEARHQVRRLNADYDAKPEEFHAVLETLDTQRRLRTGEVTELAMKLRQALTREEWEAMTKDR